MINNLILDLQIAVNSKTNLPTREQIVHWLAIILSPFRIKAELTIRIVDEKESRHLNKTYRNKDKSTNVLSFPFDPQVDIPIPLLGDLVICKNVVEQEALSQNKHLQSHWAHMITHGVLHLLGYDHITNEHAEEMETLEIQIMHQLGFENPYQLNN